MGILPGILTALLVLVCAALIGLILIQRGKGGGLAGVFGGGGVEQAFGTQAATMAQKATAVLAVLFLAITVILGLKLGRGSSTLESPGSMPLTPAPVSTPASSEPTAPAAPIAPAESAPAQPAPATEN